MVLSRKKLGRINQMRSNVMDLAFLKLRIMLKISGVFTAFSSSSGIKFIHIKSLGRFGSHTRRIALLIVINIRSSEIQNQGKDEID